MRRLSTLTATLFAALTIGLFSIGGARAADVSKFTPEALAQAQAAGEPILVAIQAPWCPVCAAQKPVLHQIEADASYQKLRVLLVDFDTQKQAVRDMGATMQSTLVVFHGSKEVARTVGDTNPETIRATVRRSLI